MSTRTIIFTILLILAALCLAIPGEITAMTLSLRIGLLLFVIGIKLYALFRGVRYSESYIARNIGFISSATIDKEKTEAFLRQEKVGAK